MTYPSSLDSFTAKIDAVNDVMAEDINGVQNAILGIENTLGLKIQGGWLPAQVTWTRISDTSFSAPGDLTEFYGMGTKFRCVVGGVVRQGYFISAAYVAPNTIVTTVGDLLTGAISEPYFSTQSSPGGFKHWFNWVPVYSGSGSMTFTAVTTTYARFKIEGRMVTYVVRASGTTGGTAGTTILLTVPVVGINIGATTMSVATFVDTGVGIARGYIDPASGLIGTVKQAAGIDGNWGLGTARQIINSGFYEG